LFDPAGLAGNHRADARQYRLAARTVTGHAKVVGMIP
jgi:hypothetical protein